MRKSSFCAIAVLAAMLTGCTVGPKYSKPDIPAAPQFSEALPQGWKQASPSDAQLRGDWWTLFGDDTLNQLIPQVAAANQSIKAAEANFRVAREQIAINRSNLFPTVALGAGVSSNRISNYVPVGAAGANYGEFTIPITASWDADFWGRIRHTIALARADYQASAADLENSKLQLQTELAADYFEIRALDEQKKILDATVVDYQRALELTSNRYKGGIASKVEVSQAQAQLDQTQAQLIEIGVARATFEHAIAVLAGKQPEGFHIPEKPLTDAPPAVPLGLPSQLLERRPDIASAERQVAAANEQIGIARTAFFPDLTIAAEGGLQAGSLVNLFGWPARFWAVGPQVLQTVFDAGRRRAQLRSAEASYDATVAEYRQTSLTAFREVEDNLSTLRILEQEQAKQHQATVAAQTSAQLSMNRYKGGLITYLDVITAQNIELTNERTEMDLLRRRTDATVQLIRALGGGWSASKLPS